MNQELQHFLTDVKNTLSTLDFQLMANNLNYEETTKTISSIQKAITNIKNIVKMKKDLDDSSKK